MFRTLPLALGAAILTAAAPPAVQAPVPSGPEARIPRFSSDGFIEYRRDANRGLYIRARSGKWYYARPLGRCSQLVSSSGLGFETSELGYFDRYSTIVAEGQRCMLASVVEAPAPPRTLKR